MNTDPALEATYPALQYHGLDGPGWLGAHLSETPSQRTVDRLIHAGTQIGMGLFLASLFGLAIGMFDGGLGLAQHALFVPAGIVAVLLMGAPSYYVAMALIDAPIRLADLLNYVGRATLSTGIVLAGLAPLAALYAVTSEYAWTPQVLTLVMLIVAGILGLRTLLSGLSQKLSGEADALQRKAALVSFGFAVFATAIAAKTWLNLLPLMQGVTL